jgi:hypothetical protein
MSKIVNFDNSGKEVRLFQSDPFPNECSETIELQDANKVVQGKICFFKNVYQTAVVVSQIDNYSKKTSKPIPSIGFYLMKMAIGSTPSCRTELCSLPDPVFFYWKLGFRPQDKALTPSFEQEFKRGGKVSIGTNMYLPFKARYIWKTFLAADRILQRHLQHSHYLIQIIGSYVDFEERVFGTQKVQKPPKKRDYFFKRKDKVDVVLGYAESRPGSIWTAKLHHIHDSNIKFATMEYDGKVTSLTNHTQKVEFEETVPGLCFFLLKKAFAANIYPLSVNLLGCKRLFTYYKWGFRLDPQAERFKEGKVEMDKLLKEFARALQVDSKPQCHYGHLARSLNYRVSLVLPEKSIKSWQIILASESSLQEYLWRNQKPIELIQQYLLPRIQPVKEI